MPSPSSTTPLQLGPVRVPSRLPSLGRRLLVLVAVPLLPALAILVLASTRLRDAARAQARAAVGDIAFGIGATAAREIGDARALLDSMARLAAVTRGSDDECHRTLAALQAGRPELNALSRTRPDGLLTCAALPLAAPVSVVDHASFQRPLRSRRFEVGDFQISRVTRQPVLVLAQPWFDETGRFRWMLAASLKLEAIEAELVRARRTPQTEIVLLDSAGTLLAAATSDTARPHLARLVAQARARPPQDDATRLDDVTAEDGSAALLATRLVVLGSRTAVVLAVRVPTRVAYAQADRALARDLLILVLGALASVAVAWRVAQRHVVASVRPLVETARRLLAGDTAARVGSVGHVAEFEELGATVDAMIDALLERQAQYSALADRSPDAILRATPRGAVLYENAVARLLRARAGTAEPVLGAPWSALIEAVVATGEPTAHEVTLELPDDLRILDLRAVPERDAIGHCVSVLIVGRDVTAQRRADDEAAQAHRLESIGRVAESLSAKVTRVIDGAGMHAEVLALLIEPTHPAHGEVAALRETLAEGAAFARDLRASAAPHPVATTDGPLIDAVHDVRAALAARHVALEIAPGDCGTTVRLDRGQFEQLVRTLLARDAEPATGAMRVVGVQTGAGQVPVEVRRRFQLHDGEYAWVAFHEAGRTIPSVLLPRLFEPFVATGQTSRGRAGLGLSSCLGIARRHGGAIAVASDAATGTTFTLWFPIVGTVAHA